jgi:hypothetical protein
MGLLSNCFEMNKAAVSGFVSSSSCYWTIDSWLCLLKNRAASAIGLAQIWMQILSEVTQF